MTLLHLLTLALIQGITEFLPISSSAHLVLLPALTGWPDQGLEIDIAVHLGTLAAVTVYFRRDVMAMARGARGLLRGRADAGGRLALQIAVATLPVIVAGWAISQWALGAPRDLRLLAWVIAATSIGFGLLLWAADAWARKNRSIDTLGWGAVLVIGVAQTLALIPGTSRSGVTMTAGRLVGLSRREAARFGLLLGIPTILAAGLLATAQVIAAGDAALGRDALVAAALSFLAAWAAIALMMRWLERIGFLPFVVYRVALGVALIGYLLATG